VRAWLDFITRLDKATVKARFDANRAECIADNRAAADDDGANRMSENYAAVLTAGQLMADFMQAPFPLAEFAASLKKEMNSHIAATTASREVWVWIIERLFVEIDAGNYKLPVSFEEDYTRKDNAGGSRPCILLRTSHVMAHLQSSMTTKEWFDTLPIKSDRALKKSLRRAGVIFDEEIERVVKRGRISNLVALDLERLAEYGLSVSRPEHPHHENEFY